MIPSSLGNPFGEWMYYLVLNDRVQRSMRNSMKFQKYWEHWSYQEISQQWVPHINCHPCGKRELSLEHTFSGKTLSTWHVNMLTVRLTRIIHMTVETPKLGAFLQIRGHTSSGFLLKSVHCPKFLGEFPIFKRHEPTSILTSSPVLCSF